MVIRPIAICVFSYQQRILVEKDYDPVKEQTFYRPLGGGIEFGEYSYAAVAREIREELGAEVTGLRFLGTLENIFIFNGAAGHEIVQVYDGEFVDRSLYEREQLSGTNDHGKLINAMWLPITHFAGGSPPLYPDGLFELLTEGKIRA